MGLQSRSSRAMTGTATARPASWGLDCPVSHMVEVDPVQSHTVTCKFCSK